MPDESDETDGTPIGSVRPDPVADEDEEIASSSERSYYYDDAHGYEDFDPDADDDRSADE